MKEVAARDAIRSIRQAQPSSYYRRALETVSLCEIIDPRPAKLVKAMLPGLLGSVPLESAALVQADNRLPALVPWGAIDSLLFEAGEAQQVDLFAGSQRVSPAVYLNSHNERARGRAPRIRYAEFIDALRAGARATVRCIDERIPAVSELADSLEYCLRERVEIDVNVACSPPPVDETFVWEELDCCVIQVEGEATWEVRAPSRSDPVRGDDHHAEGTVDAPPRAGDMSLVVMPGEAAYFPRGWWRRRKNIAVPSIELAIYVQRLTLFDQLAWVRAVARELPWARSTLPVRPGEGSLAEDHSRELLDLVSLRGSAIYRDYQNAIARSRNRLGLAGACNERLVSTHVGEIRCKSARPIVIYRDVADIVWFATAGKVVDVESESLPLIETLLSGEPVPPHQRHDTEHSAVSDVVEALVLDGVMQLENDGDEELYGSAGAGRLAL